GAAQQAAPAAAPRPSQKVASVLSADLTIDGNISGAGELQIDGVIKGDVRIERVTVGDGGQVEGGIYAEAVEVRGKVSGSITAKQVRLYGNCHVDGDITHEQLAMETGAFFQGRSLRLQRPAAAAQPTPAPRVEIPASSSSSAPLLKDANGLTPKASPAP
ncbi:MAG TPA: polymer-forming cytoskeletal protein, partial [Caulobacteraceae bacterium]